MEHYKKVFKMKKRIEQMLQTYAAGLTLPEMRYNLQELFVGDRQLKQHLRDLMELKMVKRSGRIYAWAEEVKDELPSLPEDTSDELQVK